MLVQREVTRVFHDTPYTVSVQATAQSLSVSAESPSLDRWKGDFTASFVEEVCKRTGSSKSYPTFVKMLVTSIDSPDDSNVSLDILRTQDLDSYRGGLLKTGSVANGVSKSFAGPPADGKRYLILTYRSEFDRVHYPLSLSPDLEVDANRLKAEVVRLRAELASTREQLLVSSQQAQRLNGAGASTKELETLIEGFKEERNRLELKVAHASEGGRSSHAEVVALKSRISALELERDRAIAAAAEKSDLLAEQNQREIRLSAQLRSVSESESRLRALNAELEARLASAKNSQWAGASSVDRSRSRYSRSPSPRDVRGSRARLSRESSIVGVSTGSITSGLSVPVGRPTGTGRSEVASRMHQPSARLYSANTVQRPGVRPPSMSLERGPRRVATIGYNSPSNRSNSPSNRSIGSRTRAATRLNSSGPLLSGGSFSAPVSGRVVQSAHSSPGRGRAPGSLANRSVGRSDRSSASASASGTGTSSVAGNAAQTSASLGASISPSRRSPYRSGNGVSREPASSMVRNSHDPAPVRSRSQAGTSVAETVFSNHSSGGENSSRLPLEGNVSRSAVIAAANIKKFPAPAVAEEPLRSTTASEDLSEIDARLLALQNFLRKARSNAGPTLPVLSEGV